MSLDYQALKDELAAAHPVTGAYNADDDLAAEEVSAFNVAVEVTAQDFLRYCVENNYRTNNGQDTAQTNIYGRIKMVSEAVDGADVFGQGGGTPPEVSVGQIAAAKTLIAFMESDLAVLGADAQVDGAITKMQGADAISSAQATAIKALGDNKTNRAEEIGFGRSNVNGRHVAEARSL